MVQKNLNKNKLIGMGQATCIIYWSLQYNYDHQGQAIHITLHTPGGSVISNAKNTRYRSDKMHNLMECTIQYTPGSSNKHPRRHVIFNIENPQCIFPECGGGVGWGNGEGGGEGGWWG